MLRILFYIIGFISLAWSGLDSRPASAAPQEMIRIAIARNVAEVVVEGEGLIARRENGKAVWFQAPVRIGRSRDAVTVNGTAYRRLLFTSDRAVFVNGKPYRGAAEITVADKGLLVVNELPLEEYLVGLINCEISSAWPIEAVKAQAVIARTYAMHRKLTRKKAPYHMESTVIDQVYEGCLIEDSRAGRAVSETAGEVLTYKGTIAQAYYHSNCGGRTESVANVWNASLSYLKGVECQYCKGNPSSVWEQRLSLKELEARLKSAGFKVSGVTGVREGELNSRGRLRHVMVVSSRGTLAIGGDQFRKTIGYGVIKSTNMHIKVANGEVLFSGTGSGHGVGLCQWGAKQRALDGFSYTEILSYYYPGTELSMLFELR